MRHCFSVDVEGFCEAMAESFPVPTNWVRSKKEQQEIEINIDKILEYLADANVTGTFFTLGNIAKEQPQVVRKIAEAGHEIGSHSYFHKRLYNFNKEKIFEYISSSKKELEDASGSKVFGFRAPDFSINQKTIFILDMILECGFTYDSSIFPISGHDVYGISNAKPNIHHIRPGLLEFPPSTYKLMGCNLPILGGGYFRLSPLMLSSYFLKYLEKKNRPGMVYIHPFEMGGEFPIIKNLSRLQYFRHYVNITKSMYRFKKLFKKYEFGPAIDILNNYQNSHL